MTERMDQGMEEMPSWAARGAAGRVDPVALQLATALAGVGAGVPWQGAASLRARRERRERAIRREIRFRGGVRRERPPGLVRRSRRQETLPTQLGWRKAATAVPPSLAPTGQVKRGARGEHRLVTRRGARLAVRPVPVANRRLEEEVAVGQKCPGW